MKAWVLESLGGELSLVEVEDAQPDFGAVRVSMKAAPILSYLGDYVRGELPGYVAPSGAFTPGTNGVGVVSSVGKGVYHFKVGDRVIVNPLHVTNEPVAEPAQILIGLTRISTDSDQMMLDWPHGSLRQEAMFPASSLVLADGLDSFSDEQLATLGKFIVPYGGLRRLELRGGETIVVHGATGYFGSAAVLLALAMGARRVVAAGRNAEILERLSTIDRKRVVAVPLSGVVDADVEALRAASGSSVDAVFDIVGRANSASGTLASLRSMRRGGRMVVMGSLMVPLEIDYNELMINDWSLHGQFMYGPDAYPSLLDLVKSGLLDLNLVDRKTFAFDDLYGAIAAAETMGGMECTVVSFSECN